MREMGAGAQTAQIVVLGVVQMLLTGFNRYIIVPLDSFKKYFFPIERPSSTYMILLQLEKPCKPSKNMGKYIFPTLLSISYVLMIHFFHQFIDI